MKMHDAKLMASCQKQSTPDDFATRLARDVARWKEVVKRANIKIDTHG
jgi:hypothetical protein